MRLGVCANAIQSAEILARSSTDHVEVGVQGFLEPRDADESAWQARRAAAQACARPLPAANCFLPGDLPCVGPAVDRPAIRRWAQTAFRRAREAGIGIIVFGSGGARRIPEGWAPAEARRQFVDLLRELGPLAAAEQVTIALEPLNSAECNFVTSVAEGAAIVRETGVAGVRLLADIYHMMRDNEGPQAIVDAGPLLVHVHVAERQDRTAPGVAGDDFRPYLRALAGIGYAGAISIESGWKDLASGLDPALGELRRQVADVAAGR